MPAEKSKNSLPSTSSTTMPRPRFATSGYDRVYEGEIYFSSPARMRLALGPGIAVLSLGPAVLALAGMVLVVMGFSSSSHFSVAVVRGLRGCPRRWCGDRGERLEKILRLARRSEG